MNKQTISLLVTGLAISSLAVLSGCATAPPLLPETKATMERADTLEAEGKRYVEDGKLRVKEGKAMQTKGDELIGRAAEIRKGANTLEKAEKMRREGEAMKQRSVMN